MDSVVRSRTWLERDKCLVGVTMKDYHGVQITPCLLLSFSYRPVYRCLKRALEKMKGH